jgi:FimV-like protein
MTLMTIIIQSYTSILYAIGAVSLLLFSVGLYFIVRLTGKKPETLIQMVQAPHKPAPIDKILLPDTASDVSTISGEDPMATQLDLARAYIETGKKQFAKIILAAVIKEGNNTYQEEAKRLLSSM